MSFSRSGGVAGLAFGLFLLVTDGDHDLRPDKLILLLVQLRAGIVYKNRHDVLYEQFLSANSGKRVDQDSVLCPPNYRVLIANSTLKELGA